VNFSVAIFTQTQTNVPIPIYLVVIAARYIKENSMPRAVTVTEVTRTPQDKGSKIAIEITQYDNGLWLVNSEPCRDRKEVDRVVANILNEKLGE
jgi:hypothetical protein